MPTHQMIAAMLLPAFAGRVVALRAGNAYMYIEMFANLSAGRYGKPLRKCPYVLCNTCLN